MYHDERGVGVAMDVAETRYRSRLRHGYDERMDVGVMREYRSAESGESRV